MKELRRMTLEEKAGQLFFVGFRRFNPDAETEELLSLIRPGGIVFSQRNIESIDQVQSLTGVWREKWGIPTFLAIEQEGGQVDRLKHLFAPLPSMQRLASSGTASLRAGARVIASQLEALGLNLNFAPVLDLSRDGGLLQDRALSASPLEVSRLGGAVIEELARKNIIACLKHFPGLGAAHRDPHFSLPKVEQPKRLLQQEDMLPFLNLIDDAAMMMISHAHYPALGDERPLPASLSAKVVDGFLRRKLGFHGVIITADLTMGAISAIGLSPEIFLRAFEAGNDMLLFSETTPLVAEGFRAIVQEARASSSFRARLDQSVARILALKDRLRYAPLRYRAHLRARIQRQIEKLQPAAEHIRFSSGHRA